MWVYFKKNLKVGDIIHVHLFPAIFYVSLLRIIRVIPKCKLILTEHNTFNKRRNNFLGKIIDYIIYTSYDNIIAISKATKDSLLNWKPYLSNKVKIIPNGLNLNFKLPITREKSKSNLVIISVGRLHKQKIIRLP